jgi:hypothetical protein
MVNVSTESVMAQKVEKDEASKKEKVVKPKIGNFVFDEKHYLNTRLNDGETEKEIVVRLLPFSQTELSPFKKIRVHSVKMLMENGSRQWKKFMCPVGMKKSDKCPFCETAYQASKLRAGATDLALCEKYKTIESMNYARDYWLVRCIDRAHEDHGVKFWRFPDARNGEGIWDKIYSLFETKKRRGVEIFDLYNGKDLVITVKKQVDASGNEKMVYLIQDDEKTRPLAETNEQMEAWVNDPMTWEDVYTIKDYDYLDLVVKGEYPVWSKSLGKWIAKSDADKIKEESKRQEVVDNLKPKSKDFSEFTVDSGYTKTEMEIQKDDEIDLPF